MFSVPKNIYKSYRWLYVETKQNIRVLAMHLDNELYMRYTILSEPKTYNNPSLFVYLLSEICA